ncbi:MAG: hypothetical protein K940chlam5_00679 [Candidatus Anoxychlamydiales bacterium]|nr:hypothetical protein [Candidatus Anoxychlamydiales bacterium]
MSKFKILLFCFVFLFFKLHCEIITTEKAIKPNSLYEKYLDSEIRGYIKDYLLEISNRIGLENKEYDFIIDSIKISTPLLFKESKKHPIIGEWYHRIILTDDAQTWIFNITFEAQYNRPPKTIARIMGKTNASLILEQDVLTSIEIFSREHILENKKGEFSNTFMVVDSYEITPPPSLLKKEGYYEKWIAQACGKQVPFIIEFIADGNGGSYFTVFDLSKMQLPK